MRLLKQVVVILQTSEDAVQLPFLSGRRRQRQLPGPGCVAPASALALPPGLVAAFLNVGAYVFGNGRSARQL